MNFVGSVSFPVGLGCKDPKPKQSLRQRELMFLDSPSQTLKGFSAFQSVARQRLIQGRWGVGHKHVHIKRHEAARLSSMRWTNPLVLARRPASLSPRWRLLPHPLPRRRLLLGFVPLQHVSLTDPQLLCMRRTWTALSLQALYCGDSLQRKQLQHALKAEKTSWMKNSVCLIAKYHGKEKILKCGSVRFSICVCVCVWSSRNPDDLYSLKAENNFPRRNI